MIAHLIEFLCDKKVYEIIKYINLLNNMNIQIQKDQQLQTKIVIRKKVIILSFYYFLVTVTFASFSTVAIYLHQKYHHKGYGQAYLTANSLTSVITYIFCPIILEINKFKSTTLLILCTFGYFINMMIPAMFSMFEDINEDDMNVPPPTNLRFFLEILANAIGGVASGLYWVLNGVYMAEYCKSLPQNKKGWYFSISNIIMNSRVVFGSFLTMLGLGMGNQTIYFLILSFIVLSSLPIPMWMIPNIDLKKQSESPLADNTVDEQIQPKNQQQNKVSMFQYLCDFAKYYCKVIRLVPSSILFGFVIGFVSSSLSHLLPKPAKGQNNDTLIATALVFFGIGNVLGGYLSGYFCDHLTIKIAGYIGNGFVIINSILQAIFLANEHTLNRACLVGFISGLSFSYLMSYVMLVCTIYYKGNSFSFAVNRQISSFSYIVYQWSVAFLNNKCNMRLNMTYQGLGLIPLAVIAAYCIKLECDRYEKQQLNKSESETNMDNQKGAQIKNYNSQNQN